MMCSYKMSVRPMIVVTDSLPHYLNHSLMGRLTFFDDISVICGSRWTLFTVLEFDKVGIYDCSEYARFFQF